MWSVVETGGGAGAGAPCARGKHAAALVGRHVYVVGGRGAGGALPLRDCWRYSLAECRWERVEARGQAQAPPALQEHTATAHGARVYVFGGEAGALGETPLWVLDTQIWRKLSGPGGAAPAPRRRAARGAGAGAGAAPRGRRGHSAHALNDCLLIYGGYMDLKGSTNELWAFHYESETWQSVRTCGAGPARHRHAAALHAARLYVHAGQCDLRACADLWHYDTMSRVWTCVRTPARVSPTARAGHAALAIGPHLYIFGGEAGGHASNELWRFHFATETWERTEQSLQWPSPRVDCRALLVPLAPRPRSAPAPAPTAPAARPDSLLREISKLSSFRLRRARGAGAGAGGAARCSYSVLPTGAPSDRDSTESLARPERDALAKSRSAYAIDGRQPADGGESPREADAAEAPRELARERISVPDFADMVLPTPVLSPAEAAKLVYLDSDEEEAVRREMECFRRGAREALRGAGADAPPPPPPPARAPAIPKSASVRFSRDAVTVTTEEEGDLSTSDYASAERVNRLSGASLGFSNPHYLGPDVRQLGAAAALTPDSGVAPGDIELVELGARPPRARPAAVALSLLVVGGREPPHPARLQAPLSMWTYSLL